MMWNQILPKMNNSATLSATMVNWGYLTTENDGNGTRITYYVDESIPNDKQAISEAIEHLETISLSVRQKVGEGITVID